MRNTLLIVLLLILSCSMVFCQESSEEQETQTIGFIDSSSALYSQYIQSSWIAYPLSKGDKNPVRTSVRRQPMVEESIDTMHFPDTLPFELVPRMGSHRAVQSNYVYDRWLKPPRHSFNFFGRRVSFFYDTAITLLRLDTIDPLSVATLWDQMRAADMVSLANQVGAQSTQLHLNDWGTLLLAEDLASRLYPNQKSLQSVTIVFFLVNLGLNVRLCSMNDQLALLVSTCQDLYDRPYTTIAGVRYYLYAPHDLLPMRCNVIYSYERNYMHTPRPLDLAITRLPSFGTVESSQSFKCTVKGHSTQISAPQALMDFYKRFPLCEISIYYNAPLWESLAADIREKFAPVVHNAPLVEGVALLLSFVQRTFPYSGDQFQFGHSRTLFADEVLYYPSSDMVDRAIFFAHLVNIFYNLPTALLCYGDYVVPVVALPDADEMNGATIAFGGRTYIACDPTLYGAHLGQIPQRYLSQTARVIY